MLQISVSLVYYTYAEKGEALSLFLPGYRLTTGISQYKLIYCIIQLWLTKQNSLEQWVEE